MKTKRLFISTLIAAAAMGLSAYANEAATQTTPVIAETDAPEGADQILPLADAPAAEDAEAPADEETQDDADALELLLADDALVELDEAAAPDELSTETMMREWIARYAAAARFAGIRAVKGTGGGLSSGGALATAGAELAVSAATPTPSVSVPAAGTVSLADTLTRASAAADVSLGSASASDTGTPVAVATTSSSSGASAILPAAFFSTRGVFAAVPAATASYSLASSSGVAAATMSAVPAFAKSYTITSSNDTNLTSATSADTVTIDFSANSNSWLVANDNSSYTINAAVVITDATIHNGYSNKTYVFENSVSGSGPFYYQADRGSNNQTYVFNGDVSGYSGEMSAASGKTATFTFTNKTGTGTITATNASSVLNLTGATVNNSAISVSTVNIDGATFFVKTTDLNSGNIVLASGAAMNIASTGALDLSSSTLNASNGTVSIATDGSLDLSGGNITLGSAIANSGTVTVSAETVFNLTQTGTTTFIGGGRIDGCGSLRSSNFIYYGAAIDTMRSSSWVATESSVAATFSVADLTWAGTSESSTWDVKATKNWTNVSTGNLDMFYNGDNVTFSSDAAVTVATGGVTAGAVNITAGTVSFSGGTITAVGGVSVTGGTLSVGANNTALGTNTITLSGGTLLAASATGTLTNAVNVAAASIINTQGNTLTLSGAVSGSGTLTKQGAGTLKLATGFGGTGDTRWTAGNLVVGSGTLQWGQGDTGAAIANQMKALGETISVSSGAALKIHLWTQTKLTTSTTDKVAVTSKIILNGTSTLETVDGSYYFSGGIQVGDGTNAGTGTFTANWRKGHVIGSLSGAGTFTINEQAGNDDHAAIFSIAGDGGFNGTVNFNYKSGDNSNSAGAELHLLTGNALKNATVNLTSAVGGKTATLSLDAATVNIKGLTGTSAGRVVAATAGNTLAIATETGVTNTFLGTVGTSTSAVGLSVSGSGTQAFKGTSYFSTVSVGAGATLDLSGMVEIAGTTTVGSGGTLDVSGGNVRFGGAFTTEGSAKLVLGTLSADTAAILATGAVTISGGTIFDMTEASASLKLVAGSSVVADGLGIANIYVGGKLVNQRGIASFSVSDAGVLTLDSYTEGVNYSLTWTGGDADVWKVNGSGWRKDEGSTAENFQDGDSVTFSIAGAQVTVEGVVNPVAIGDSPAITVAANTTFKGADATVNVANGSLAFSNNATLEIQNGVTLDFGTAATALDLSNVTGDGTVKYVFNANAAEGGAASGLVTSDGFTGTVDYVGNLNWSDNGKEGQVTIGNAAMTLRLTSRDGQTDGMWGRFDKTFANNVEFGSDYKIWLTSGSVAFAGRVDAAGKTLTTEGGSNLTFSGTANVGTLNVTGGTVAVTGAGALTATVSNLAAGSSLTLAGTDANNKSTIALSRSTSISGNLTIGNATVDASGRGDIFNYNVSQAQKITLNEGGTLALGSNRQSFNKYVSFELNGGTITGTGDQYGAVDLYGANTIAVKKDSEISATIRMRSNESGGRGNVTVDVDEGVTLLLSGAINRQNESNTTRKIVKSGSGAMKLTADNSYFAAGFEVSAGTLVAAHEKALGTGTVTAAGSNGVNEVTLRIGETGATSALTITNNISVSADKTLSLESANAGNKLTGNITGANGALKLASGTLTLSGANSYTGGTTIENGTLVAGSAGALGSGPVSIGNNATLKIGVSKITINGLSGVAKTNTAAASKIALADGTASATVTLNITGEDSYSGYFDGAIWLVKTGTGTLDLTGDKNNLAGSYGAGNTFSGTVKILEGAIKTNSTAWGSKGSLGTDFTYSGILLNGGVLEVTAKQNTTDDASFGGGGAFRGFSVIGSTGTYRYSGTEYSSVAHHKADDYIGLANGATLIFDVKNRDVTLEVTKVIAKNEGNSAATTTGALKKTGAGTLVLNPNAGTNNFTGGVTIEKGTLVAGSENALGTGAETNVVKLSGGTLEVRNGVTLAQTNIEITLSDLYKTETAITGTGKLANGTTITISKAETAAMSLSAEAAQDAYKIYAETLVTAGSTVNVVLSPALKAEGWSVMLKDGVYMMAIPEPSLFGLLAGVTALGFSMSSRRRRKKA